MSNIEIIPAIIPKDHDDLSIHLSRVKGLVPLVQIDILDGRLTPEASWPYENDRGEFAKITSGEEGFPFWRDLEFEVDLMVQNPADVVEDWFKAGAKRFIIHIESKGALEALSALEDLSGASDDSMWKSEVGLALNTQTDNGEVLKHAERIDFVQCMGIAEIGSQGQPFDERVLEKIASFKDTLPDMPISVDGSVNLETASKLVKAGAIRLVAGSAIFTSMDVEKTIEKFREIVV